MIRYGPQHETFVKMLDRNGKKDLVRDAMTSVLQRPVGVTFEVDAEADVARRRRPRRTEPRVAARAAPARRPGPAAAARARAAARRRCSA